MTDQPSVAGAAARRWRAGLLLGAVVLAVLLWFVVRGWNSKSFEWKLFAQTFAGLNPLWIGASCVFALLTYVGRALRWKVLIRPQKPHAEFWNLLSGTAIGFTAIVLFGRPGEMVRPYLIAMKERLSFSSQMAAWVLERLYDLMMALLIFGFALSHVRGSGVRASEGLQWVLSMGGYLAGGIGMLCLVLFIALRQFGESSRRRILDAATVLPDRVRYLLDRGLGAFTTGLESTRDWGTVLAVLAYSVLEWILIVACNACFFQASPATTGLGLTDVMIFVGFVAFGNVIQIPGIGGGMQLVAVMIFSELFGMPVEVSGGLALALWAITFVVVVPLGLLLAFHEGVNWGKLRHIQDEASNP